MTFPQILVVDNEPCITEAFSIILANQGFDIQSANSNEDALTYLKKCSYDLVLSDVHMQGMSFSDFILNVRHIDHAIPILAITGLPQFISDNDQSMIQGVLEKPFRQDILIKRVQDLLGDQ